MDKQVCIKTNCCAVQRHETYRISEFFRTNDWDETEEIDRADVIVITTCGVTEDTENESLALIDEVYQKAKCNSKVVVAGCLPNISKETLMNKYPDAIYIPMDKMDLFDSLINAEIGISSIVYNVNPKFHHSQGDPRIDEHIYDADYKAALRLAKQNDNPRFVETYNYLTPGRYLWNDSGIFEIKVSSGCVKKCSYCASRIGIGEYRSKSIQQIIKEVDDAVIKGYKTIMLMGDELGAYGLDIGSSFVELLETVMKRDSSIRIGIRYIHPEYLHIYFPKIEKFLSRIFFMCISIQSGSNRVLKDMNREESIDDIEEDVVRLRALYPEMYIHTQIIVGFPTETEEDFDMTMRVLERCRFDYVRYNVFSAREGTEASKLGTCYSQEELLLRKKRIGLFCKRMRKELLYERYIKLLAEEKVN